VAGYHLLVTLNLQRILPFLSLNRHSPWYVTRLSFCGEYTTLLWSHMSFSWKKTYFWNVDDVWYN
jgi:hypothetical protein